MRKERREKRLRDSEQDKSELGAGRDVEAGVGKVKEVSEKKYTAKEATQRKPGRENYRTSEGFVLTIVAEDCGGEELSAISVRQSYGSSEIHFQCLPVSERVRRWPPKPSPPQYFDMSTPRCGRDTSS